MILPLLFADLSGNMVTALVQAGLLGPIVLWFMWRDGKEREQYSARAEKHDAKMDTMIEALNHLILMTGMEVTTRPNVVQRTKDEASELVAAVERRRKGAG